jgi:hypothetical protein
MRTFKSSRWVPKFRVRGRSRGTFQFQSHHTPHRAHNYWSRHKEMDQ